MAKTRNFIQGGAVMKWVVGALVLALSQVRAGEEKEKPAVAPAVMAASMSFYNFSDLINKAERIVLGEIAEKKDGAYTIKALETLKAPAPDTSKISADAYKRAEELLKAGKSSVPPSVKPKGVIENISIAVIPVNDKVLPPPGTQAVFFLWDVEPRPEGAMPLYRINHPQCVYDSKVLPLVRSGLLAPRSISDGRFLREWDQRAADRVKQRKDDDELKKAAGGEAVRGMQLDIVRPHLLVRGDNSFQVASHLLNTFSKETMAYDGPASSYGIILRAKNAPPESALVLHLNKYDDLDPALLNITSLTDFESIPGNNMLVREHRIDIKKLPDLKTFSGEYSLKMFYINTKDGVKDGLSSPAWIGTLVSKELILTFKKVDVKAP